MNINAQLLALALLLRSQWAALLASATHTQVNGVSSEETALFCLSPDNRLLVLTEQLVRGCVGHFVDVATFPKHCR